MDDKINLLVQNAVLDVLDFDVHKYDQASTMNYTNRVLPFYVMSYIKEGRARVCYKGKTYSTGPGTVVILPPGEPHDHIKEVGEETTFLWWHFTFKISNIIDILKVIRFPITFKMPDSRAFENAFCQYIELTRKPMNLSNVIMKKAKSLEVMAFLFEGAMMCEETGYNHDIPEAFADILLDIVCNPGKECSLQLFAQQHHMHPTYISNRFKELFGVTPIQLHRKVVIDKAKSLLRTSEMSIGQVACALGYDSISSFSRFFAKHEGISPIQFKKMCSKK